ncbi:MAG: hypothetical protein JWN30_857 [Bacilli bacterium]|nr:hypothetical protein [Bacilli bacterium]
MSSNSQEKLLEQEQRYISLLENNPDGICSLDLTGQFVEVNPAYERITGYSKTELLSLRYLDLMFEEDRLTSSELIAKAFSVELTDVQLRLMHKQGFSVEIIAKSVPIIVNHRVVGIYIISKDITERNLMEQAVREGEAKYRLIAENSTDLIGILAPQGTISYASPSHQFILGYSPEVLEGRKAIEFIHPEDQPAVRGEFADMIRLKLPFQAEFRYRHQNGGYLIVESRLIPVMDPHGEVDSVVAVVRDLTERKKSEELLQKSEKLAVIGQLAAGVAHEIRNPLTAIKGFLQLLRSKTTDQHHPYYDLMLSELNRINTIVNEFMYLAKPQAVQFQQVDIRALIQSIIPLLETQAILNSVQIKTILNHDIPPITCEENQIKQVLINFLKNAIEAMPQGGHVFIEVECFHEAEIKISLIDEGCGIPEERIPRLGEPFYTTKEKGTGLGLMVSHKIIENHRGRIHISSEIGVGTTIEVFLPLAI